MPEFYEEARTILWVIVKAPTLESSLSGSLSVIGGAPDRCFSGNDGSHLEVEGGYGSFAKQGALEGPRGCFWNT